jgi:hypothetical protein
MAAQPGHVLGVNPVDLLDSIVLLNPRSISGAAWHEAIDDCSLLLFIVTNLDMDADISIALELLLNLLVLGRDDLSAAGNAGKLPIHKSLSEVPGPEAFHRSGRPELHEQRRELLGCRQRGNAPAQADWYGQTHGLVQTLDSSQNHLLGRGGIEMMPQNGVGDVLNVLPELPRALQLGRQRRWSISAGLQ